jgi:hypothetical protein
MPAPRAKCGSTIPHDWHLFDGGATSGERTPCDGLIVTVIDPAPVDEPTAETRTVEVLTDWWIDLAREEVRKVAPKAVEYGSTDLVEIGRDLASMMGWRGLSDEYLAEIGIYFYLVGKMARWRDAIHRHERVSDDTLHDIGVYVRMAQRVRVVGGWPFGTDEG